MNWLIRDIGRLSAAFTTDFLRFLTGDPRTVTSSRIGATFTRPLLRNAGYKTDIENLTQSERDLLYQVRDFVRFRKDFSVQIASAYYGVLGNRDAVRNSFLNFQSSRRTGDRTRALAAEGTDHPVGPWPHRATGAFGGERVDQRHPRLPARAGRFQDSSSAFPWTPRSCWTTANSRN